MNQHATLFAIKLMVKSLKYSETYTKPLIDLINEMIEREDNRCTDEYKARLVQLNEMINQNL
jgi:hypothetical protein